MDERYDNKSIRKNQNLSTLNRIRSYASKSLMSAFDKLILIRENLSPKAEVPLLCPFRDLGKWVRIHYANTNSPEFIRLLSTSFEDRTQKWTVQYQ
jgi:hypothetical protein